MWGISKLEEEDLLVSLRQNVEAATGQKLNVRYDTYYLRRFLRARQHDLDKAQEMFINHLKWRKEFGTDTILEDFVYEERESFLALYPQGYHKVDKLGRPIYIQHLGQINMKAMKNVTTEDRMIRFHVQEYERALKYIFPACSMVRGTHISQTLAIMDLKGVGLRHLSGDVKRILSTITNIDQNNYPETLGKTLIINAPTVFRAIWSIVKPMLDPRTLAKIEVCPSDYMPILMKWVDIENIPAYLGGKSSGSLIDDIGPWNDAEMIEEIDKGLSEAEGAKGGEREEETATSISVIEKEEEYHEEEYQEVMGLHLRRESSASTLATAYLSAEEDEGYFFSDDEAQQSLSPLNQVSILERVKGLEEQVPSLEAGMSRAFGKIKIERPSRTLGQGTLISRVEALEKAMNILMETQESLIVAKKLSQSANTGSQPWSPCCSSSCSIM